MVKVVKLGVLALMVGSVVGCGVPGLSVGAIKPVASTVSAGKGSLQVKVAALGQRAYGVLSLGDDLATLALTLRGNKYAMKRKLSRNELSNGAVQTFDAVPVGKVTLAVQVYDANGTLIGEGEEATQVKAGQVAALPVRVQALKRTGAVTAVITFDDTPGKGLRMNHEGFAIADADGDKQLRFEEFATYFPYQEIASGERVLDCAAGVAPAPDVTNDLPMLSPDGTNELPQVTSASVVPAPGSFAAETVSNRVWRRGKPAVQPLPAPIELSPIEWYPVPDGVSPPAIWDARLWFGCLDRDGNGMLGIDEFIGVQVVPLPWVSDRRDEAFTRRDRNQDGVLSLPEWLGLQEGQMGLSQANAERFRALDTDGDGVLNPAEYAASYDSSELPVCKMPLPINGATVTSGASATVNK